MPEVRVILGFVSAKGVLYLLSFFNILTMFYAIFKWNTPRNLQDHQILYSYYSHGGIHEPLLRPRVPTAFVRAPYYVPKPARGHR